MKTDEVKNATEETVLRILTNAHFLIAFARSAGIQAEELPEGWTSLAILQLHSLVHASKCDVVLINCITSELARMAAVAALSPGRSWRLVGLDMVLPPPRTVSVRLRILALRLLFRSVDQFIFYSRSTEPLERYYGVAKEKIQFLPFKANCWEAIGGDVRPGDDGDYVLVAGWSQRDLATFYRAMSLTPYPGVVYLGDADLAREHGTIFSRDGAPPNVEFRYNDGRRDDWIAQIAGARVVALPLYGDTIAPSGIGTLFDAMALGRATVMTDSVAAGGAPRGSFLPVPVGDAEAMARAISLAWDEGPTRDSLRARAVEAAKAHAGAQRLYRDLLQLLSGSCREV